MELGGFKNTMIKKRSKYLLILSINFFIKFFCPFSSSYHTPYHLCVFVVSLSLSPNPRDYTCTCSSSFSP